MKRADIPTGGIRVVVERLPSRIEGEPVAAVQRSQVVVERVVLHHEDHDVLDLGHGVGAHRKMRKGAGARLKERTVRSEALGSRRRGVRGAADGCADPGCGQSGSDGAGQQGAARQPRREWLAWKLPLALSHRRYANSEPFPLSLRNEVASGPTGTAICLRFDHVLTAVGAAATSTRRRHEPEAQRGGAVRAISADVRSCGRRSRPATDTSRRRCARSVPDRPGRRSA